MWCVQKWQVTVVIKDVGSGLNEKRKGMLRLFTLDQEQPIKYVVIKFRDRLTRYGYWYITEYLAVNGVNVVVKDETNTYLKQDRNLNKELIDDLMVIISSVSGGLYGRRSAKFRKLTRCVQQVVQDV